MKRVLLALLFLLSNAVVASAQSGFTTVSAIIQDPNGAVYTNCHGDAVFVASPSATQQSLLSGSVFQTDVNISQCDSFGNMTIVLADNNQITDGHTTPPASQWRFNISSSDNKTNFNCTMTITGNTQNVSAALQACAAPLAAQAGGGGALVVKAVPCATNIVFTMAGTAPTTSNTAFTTTLSCNVTSTSIVGNGGPIQVGAIAQFTLTQNGVGGFPFAWPANFIDKPSIQLSPTATTNASFWFDGANWHAQTFPAAGGAGGGGSPSGLQGALQFQNAGAFGGALFNYNPADSSGVACNTQSCALIQAPVDSGFSLASTDGNNSIALSAQSDVAPPVGVAQSGASLSISSFVTQGFQAIPNTSDAQIGGTNSTGGSCFLASAGTPPCAIGFLSVFGDAIGDTNNGQDAVGFSAWAGMNKSTGHSMHSVSGFLVRTPGNFTTSLVPVTESSTNFWGIEIQDLQDLGTTQTAGLHIEPQTNPSAHAFAIKGETGSGPSSLNDGLQAGGVALGSASIVANTLNFPAAGKIASASTNVAQVNSTGLESLAGKTITVDGATSGGVAIAVPAVAGGNTATLPANTGTVAELNLAQAWTAAQTFSPAIAVGSGGTGATTFTTNGILFGNAASAIGASAAGGAGTLCLVETNGGTPAFASCSGSTSTSWSNLSNPSADLSLSMGTNNSLFTSGVMTAARNAWEFLDGNSTSTGSLASFHTGATSTMKPFTACAQGTSNCVQMSSGGNFGAIGAATLTANAFSGVLTVPNGGSGAGSFTANQLLYGNGTSPFAPLVGSLIGTNPVLTLTSAATGNVPFALNTPASPTADIFDLNINSVKTAWFDNGGIIHTPSATFVGTGALVLSGTEGTCPTPAAGTDIICVGNSGTHTIQSSLNGTTFKDNMQWANSGPTAHGVVITATAFPQTNSTSAGTLGQAFVSQGASADPIFGTLGAVGGGTGTTTNTAHGVLVGEGTSAVVAVGPNATANLPLLNQVGADPIYSALPLGSTTVSGQLPVGNGGTGAATLAAANIAVFTGAITPNNCVKWSSATVITDAGSTCGGAGGASRLDQITAATASNTISSGINPQIWNWSLTGSTTAFKFGELAAATGSSNILLQASTLNTSTAIPFQADNNGNGWQLTSAGLLQRIGSASAALPGTVHGTVVSEGATAAVAVVSPGTAGQVLISNGAGSDPTYQDPIISQAYVNLWTTQDVTTTRTSAAVRNPVFSQTGTLQLTWASITGSPATCTLQIQGVDSVGNALNNGSTFSVSPANGTTSQTFAAAATLQSAAQIKAIFACVTYPTTGTLTLDYTPIPNVNVTNAVTTTPPANASTNVTQFGGVAVSTGTGAGGTGIPRVTISNDSSLAANQSVNISQFNGVTPLMNNGVSGTGSQRVNIASDNTPFETIPVTTATTTDSSSTCYLTSAASTNSTNCKGSAGNVYGIYIINTTTTNYFLRMYNASSAPTCSSATGFIETIPALGAAANGGGISRMQMAQGYGTGIGFCLTGGGGSTDNTSAATGVYITILYK